MTLPVRPRLQVVLAVLLTLAAYFPSIGHPISRFDDPFILERYGINRNISLIDAITPGGGFYYRPLVELSYWIDSILWGQEPSFMHLENIAAHLANVFLVYLIAERLPLTSRFSGYPLLSALLFGLHPVNSEPVNWIAGRTDIFAGFFVLIGVYCTILALQKRSSVLAFSGLGVFLLGSLAKETAMMFIPAVFLLSIYWPVAPEEKFMYERWRKRVLFVPLGIFSLLLAVLLALTYVMRKGDNALSMIFTEGLDAFVKPVEAFGFYAKKMFLPVPLNVAIVDVNPLYVLLGIIAFCAIIKTLRRPRISGVFLGIAALFVVPALIVASVPIAWTPFGERYLYIPSAFVVMSVLDFSYCSITRRNVLPLLLPVSAILVLVAFIATVHRGSLWGDNLVLMEDIVSKSPTFGVARNEYAILLKEKGRLAEAQEQFDIALRQKNPENVSRIIRLNLIAMKLHGKKPDERRQILLSEMGEWINADIELLKLLYTLDEYTLHNTRSLNDRRKIATGMIETNHILYRKLGEAHYLYRSGQLALSLGDNSLAADLFNQASEKAPKEAYYREPALKLVEKLRAE